MAVFTTSKKLLVCLKDLTADHSGRRRAGAHRSMRPRKDDFSVTRRESDEVLHRHGVDPSEMQRSRVRNASAPYRKRSMMSTPQRRIEQPRREESLIVRGFVY